MSEVRVGSSKDLVTVTDELRRMLDERGVGWREHRWGGRHSVTTIWHARGVEWHYRENRFGELRLHADNLTPEQAIAATLGAGTCINVAEPDEYSDRPFTCSECGARGPMGNGTYHLASSWAMEDGTLAFADSWPVWKYCPNCGRKVVTNG